MTTASPAADPIGEVLDWHAPKYVSLESVHWSEPPWSRCETLEVRLQSGLSKCVVPISSSLTATENREALDAAARQLLAPPASATTSPNLENHHDTTTRKQV